MPLDIEIKAERAKALLARADVQEVMGLRCGEQGHDMENCCSAIFRVYQRCKWCGYER